ncbi:MAG: RtcB family protein [Desulfovibrionaceae bacterium]|nr:RtcB family protein [Desulfovibrionaceae bacterium]
MDISLFERRSEYEWLLPAQGEMRVPAKFFATRQLLLDMDPDAIRQAVNVACLPGIVEACVVMPDAHSGYGFPIGGVAAFDPKRGGVVSAGGVGFDIACGVRTLTTGLTREDILARQEEVAERLFAQVPCGVGSGGDLRLDDQELEHMLLKGASWAVGRGLGVPRDLERAEERGFMPGARPEFVSKKAKERGRDQIGSLGSGNHYLEVQWVAEILDQALARAFGLEQGAAVVSIHCGSRGLGHQIGSDYLPEMAEQADRHGIRLPDRELACAPIHSDLGQRYLGAMLAGVNCALANRQAITHLVRRAFAEVLPDSDLRLVYDVAHNTCKVEEHLVEGRKTRLFVHRKGATRSFGPGHPALPADLAEAGQPVLVGGSMGASSFILAGTRAALEKSFGSACHGAGRAMSRAQARKRYKGRDVAEGLGRKGILIRSASFKGVAEEAPGAYKDIMEVVSSAAGAGLVVPVARLEPLVCVKG